MKSIRLVFDCDLDVPFLIRQAKILLDLERDDFRVLRVEYNYDHFATIIEVRGEKATALYLEYGKENLEKKLLNYFPRDFLNFSDDFPTNMESNSITIRPMEIYL